MKTKLLFSIFFIFALSRSKAQFALNALDFDGSNDIVVASSVPSFFSSPGTNDFTIEAWVFPRGSVFARIVFAQPSTTNFVSLGTNTGNTIYFYVIVNGTTYSSATTGSIPQNQWTHVTARWTAATSTPEVFFNGVLQAVVAGGGSSTGTNGLMTVGARPGGAQFFNGALDEVRIWNEARTLCKIQANMNRSISGPQTNLIVNYDFNQGTPAGNNTTVTSLPDVSGNAFNGTLTNFGLTAATSNWIASNATVTTLGAPLGGSTAVNQTTAVCMGGSYTFPDASVQNNITSQVIQTSSVVSGGCPSVITTTVNVKPKYTASVSTAVCAGSSYTFADGSSQANITSQVVHTSSLLTLGPLGGCDSLITTTVSVIPTYSTNTSVALCAGSSYTFADGSSQTNITSQIVHTSSLIALSGCDSLVTTTLTVAPQYSVNTLANLCSGSSYTFADGSTQTNITSPLIYTSTLQTTNGCDSLVITAVSIKPSYGIQHLDSVCYGKSYTFPDGSTINNIVSQAVHVSTLQTQLGCDSLISSIIKVKQVNVTVNHTGQTSTVANTPGASYQWVNCNGYTAIPGATLQTFTSTMSANYAVIVTVNGCSDTSACFLTTVGLGKLAGVKFEVSVYPNPTRSLIFIETEKELQTQIEVIEISGAIVRRANFNATRHTLDLSGLANGIYTIRITNAEGRNMQQIIKSGD